MNRSQRIIAVCTLVLLSITLHIMFCDWGPFYSSRGIIRMGADYGIVARSVDSVATDMIVGIVIPIAFVGSALYLLAASIPPDSRNARPDE